MFEGLLQPVHLIIILVIILIVFGAGKLPEVGGGLGRSITEFRKGVHETSSDDEPVDRAPASPAATPVQTTGSFCNVCGANLPPGAKFCASCGTKQAA